MTSAEVTRRELTLGARDSVTGHCAKSFSETTIKCVLVHNGVSPVNLPIGYYARWEHTAFIPDVIHMGDEIIDAQGKYYLVKAVQELWWLDQFDGYICNLSKIDEHFDREATSGTWHLDSESLKTDSRYRTKTYLETYITDTHLKLDNASTNASYVVMFSGADYPLNLELSASYNDLDLIFAINKNDSAPVLNAFHYPYKTEEILTIQTYAMNKTGLTAINLLDQAYEELKTVFTAHPIGSLRSITRSTPTPEDLGGFTLYSETVTISYVRVNDDYTPTSPAFDYGVGFIYEGDRVSGGTEGAWTLTQGSGSTCAQSVTSDKNLYLNQTVYSADSSTTNGTNLGLLTSLVPYVRFRYKTSGNATAKIVIEYSDASTSTALSETASSTFTMGTASLTAAKTVDHIILYACDGVGTVTYDFVEFYAGTYILPTCTMLEPPIMVNDVTKDIPGRMGGFTSSLGGKILEVTMEADLDMEPAALTWRIPQTSSSKSSDFPNKQDLLFYTAHRMGFYELWTWLKLESPDMQFKARLVDVSPSYTGEQGKIRLVWHEYRHGSASGETSTERFGNTL